MILLGLGKIFEDYLVEISSSVSSFNFEEFEYFLEIEDKLSDLIGRSLKKLNLSKVDELKHAHCMGILQSVVAK